MDPLPEVGLFLGTVIGSMRDPTNAEMSGSLMLTYHNRRDNTDPALLGWLRPDSHFQRSQQEILDKILSESGAH